MSRPIFRLRAGGLREDHVKAIAITDEPGFKSDKVEITMLAGAKIPALKSQIEDVAIGYVSNLRSFGAYVISAVSGAGGEIRVVGKPVAYSTALAASRTALYTETTLKGVAEQVAQRSSLAPAVSAACAEIEIRRLDQIAESDSHLLTRLARRYGMYFKIQQGNLILVPRDHTTASGSRLPVLNVNEVIGYPSFSFADRGHFTGVRAYYMDTAKADRFPVLVGEEGNVHEISLAEYSRPEALQKARAKYAELRAGLRSANVRLVGNPEVIVGQMARIATEHQPIAGDWRINRARHQLSRAGYITEIEMKGN